MAFFLHLCTSISSSSCLFYIPLLTVDMSKFGFQEYLCGFISLSNIIFHNFFIRYFEAYCWTLCIFTV